MQAVIPLTKRKKHFRHDVLKNTGEKKCTYNDETYRHKLAKDLIQIIGNIKVPAIYKFDPDKKFNQALLIRDSQFIEIDNVLIERYIYENENGEVIFEQKKDSSKNLLIKPDAIILDKEKKPILIVEFVATHKPDTNKLIKLKRLGIDAIQISIPKSSPEEIEKCFSITKHTKWLFNNEESKTDYVQFSNEYSGAIFEVDQEQRKLFEEGYKCRSAEIRGLIFTIECLLQTEYYQSIERNLRSEIQRVEGNAKSTRQRLEDIRGGYIREGIERHRERRSELENSREEFSKKYTSLEGRYIRKRNELENKRRGVDECFIDLENGLKQTDEERARINRDIDQESFITAGIRQELDSLGKRKDRDFRIQSEDFEKSRGDLESEIDRIRDSINSLQEDSDRAGRKITDRFGKLTCDSESEIKRIESENHRISESFETESGDIGARIEEVRNRILQELKKGDNSSIGRIAEEYRGIYNFRESIIEYKKTHEFLKRVEEYLRKKA